MVTNMTRSSIKFFHDAWARIPQISYVPTWANGTGYFQPEATEDVKELSASTDIHGRKIIIVPVEGEANVVIFARYKEHGSIIAFNRVWKENRLGSGEFLLDDETMASIVAQLEEIVLNKPNWADEKNLEALQQKRIDAIGR